MNNAAPTTRPASPDLKTCSECRATINWELGSYVSDGSTDGAEWWCGACIHRDDLTRLRALRDEAESSEDGFGVDGAWYDALNDRIHNLANYRRPSHPPACLQEQATTGVCLCEDEPGRSLYAPEGSSDRAEPVDSYAHRGVAR